jgi:hypothetical protein
MEEESNTRSSSVSADCSSGHDSWAAIPTSHYGCFVIKDIKYIELLSISFN